MSRPATQAPRALSGLSLLLGLLAALTRTSTASQYPMAPPANIYESHELLDNHHHTLPSSYSPSPCVLTIQQLNSSSSSYAANSYLSNYAASGHREPSYAPYGPHYPSGKSVCITQRDVDEAVEEAKASLGGYVPKEIHTANSELPKPAQVNVVAEIITQATRILANKFKLPEPAILYDLPSIDLSKSQAIDKICPLFLKPSVNCEHSKFRTLTGFCNNLQYQSWGATRSAMVRFLAPDYYDSISLPRRAYDGSPLPSARVVSFVVHQDPNEYDKFHSMFSVVWGQFIDHDMTLSMQATDDMPVSGPGRVDCCKTEDGHPHCLPIEIPKGDPFYGYFNQKCMHFMRVSAGLQPGCSLGPVQAINKISSYLDGNPVYGAGIKSSHKLRTFYQGQLKSQPVSSAGAYGSNAYESLANDEAAAYNGHPEQPASNEAADYLLAAGSYQHQQRRRSLAIDTGSEYPPASSPYKELLPPKKENPEAGCERRGRAKDVYCFEAGGGRVNEQIQLTAMHTLFLREHNRLAKALSYINPHWDDERLFQEARQIVAAEMQHITFNEYLPLVIGKEKIYEYGLELEQPGRYYQGYDSKINAGVRVEFQGAAFRYGHSILPSTLDRYNKFHQKIESIRLSKLLKQPFDLYHPGVMDSYLLGMANQRAGRMDPTLPTEVTNHLFEKPGKFFGLDLAALNIQRGRDLGIPGYNHLREYCGLKRAKYFEDLSGVMSNKTLLRLSQLYKHVDDIDLWTAGSAEYPIHDGMVGPTFACLIARQFVNVRRGDRFWYENSGYPAQFNIEQLDELRKATAARLICDNSDDIETIQASAMLVADHYTNPRVPCASLPAIDLTKWKEHETVSYGPAQATPHATSGGEYSSLANAANEYAIPMAHEPVSMEEYSINKLTGGEPANAYSSSELVSNYQDPSVKTSSTQHFVDHLVDVANYRPEVTVYNAKAAKAAKAAASAA